MKIRMIHNVWKKRAVTFFLFFFLMWTPYVSVNAAAPKLSAKKLEIAVGTNTKLTLVSRAGKRNIEWKSSNSKVVSVRKLSDNYFSPNTRQGNVEYCRERRTVYINTGSVVPTELSGEPLMPSQWKDGVITEMIFYDNSLEIRYRSIHTGLLYPRGYYRFDTPLYPASECSYFSN